MRAAAVLVLGALLTGSSAAGDVEDDQALLATEPDVTTLSAREPLLNLVVGPSAPQQWSFAVLSDMHLPNPRAATVDRTIEGLIALHVRLVIVTGDHTNGSEKVDHRRDRARAWWASVIDALEPLHDAGICLLYTSDAADERSSVD